MEEYVYNLVRNTLKNHTEEEAIKIIADKILWYEMKIKNMEEEINNMEEKPYREKVFSDLVNCLGLSVSTNAKTKEDAFEGLELLNNFNLIFNNYDRVIKTLKAKEKDER